MKNKIIGKILISATIAMVIAPIASQALPIINPHRPMKCYGMPICNNPKTQAKKCTSDGKGHYYISMTRNDCLKAGGKV